MLPQFVLASASPRRRDLLSQAGLTFTIQPADIDESPKANEAPREYVLRLSLEKATKLVGALPVLGADTVVSIDGMLLGKPNDPEAAFKMLKLLSGKIHLVHTGVSLVSSVKSQSIVTVTEVKFIDASDEALRSYIDSGEPFDKAGGYGIQGVGAFLVESISGSYTGVVGLPVEETVQLLKDFGIVINGN